MRTLFALTFIVAAACGGPKQKKETSIVDEGSNSVGETCCCKTNPISGDGTPVYAADIGRIECSTKQGECVDEVQCTQQQQQTDNEPGSQNQPVTN